MNRVIGTFALLVLALDGTVAHGENGSRPVRMTVVGDSLALGIGASDTSRGYAFLLFRDIARERPGSEVTNLAIGGTTARDVLRLEVPRIAATHPDLVLLEVGGNDGVRHRSADAFAVDDAALVHAVRAAAPNARLVIFNVPDISVSPIFEASTKPELQRLVRAYNIAVVLQARTARAILVDLFAISERAKRDDDRFFSADLFHPSDEGHAAIATAAWPTIRRAIAP